MANKIRMSNLELELHALKDNLSDMLSLVRSQLVKCREAIQKKDVDLAEDVITGEKKVNVQEIAIDRDCENILALYTPVATDLRFVLATLKITNDLERIGDNAKSLARFVKANIRKAPDKILKEYDIPGMLDILIGMLKDMGEALQKNDTKLARKTAKKDELLNDHNKQAFKTTTALVKEYPEEAKLLLQFFAVSRNLERAGDLTKNIAEEIVFHIEAKVLKHKKDRGKA
jgi:phosphate transport system protein